MASRRVLLGPALLLLLALGWPVWANGKEADVCIVEPQKECLFIVSTGRSGSTTLQDGLNQLPGVFIGGENNALLRYMRSFENLASALSGRHPHLPAFDAGGDKLKVWYNNYTLQHKPDWLAPWPRQAVQCAAQAAFRQLYGYGGFSDYLVGFKEVRYNGAFRYAAFPKGHTRGEGGERSIDSYEEFNQTMAWMRGLCGNTRIVLNQRRNLSATAASMKASWGWSNTAVIEKYAGWFDEYHAQEKAGRQVIRVYFEDITARPQAVAKTLREFTGREGKINFNRIPRWRRK